MLRTLPLLLLVFFLSGCVASSTAINKKDLDIKTQMSSTIFLQPVAPTKQVVYLQVHNTSGSTAFDLAPSLMQALVAQGYQITHNVNKAHYLLQVNMLRAGKVDNHNDVARTLAGGAGGALVGGLLGSMTNDSATTTVAALGGAALGGLIGAFVKDVTYAAVADIQISTRTNQAVHRQSKQHLQQGSSGFTRLTSEGTTHWERVQTRVVTSANKVNLSLQQAAPAMVHSMSQSIAGIF